MDVLEDIFQRCHKRHAEAEILRQRKTVITPALYKRVPYHIKVHCVRANPLTLDALENASISFMPIGHAPEDDKGPQDLGGHRFLRRQTTEDWRLRQWDTSWGIQIYTGIPSEREGARWHDLEFCYEAICDEPELVSDCIQALLNTSANPLLTLTKSGGLRFTCRIQDYLHPDSDAEKYYVYKHAPTEEDPNHCDIYLEVHGDKSYSRWDMRYEILIGNLLNPPYITKEVVFAPLHTLRAALHAPESSQKKFTQVATVPSSLNSTNLNFAKAAFLNRGFSYEREMNGFHYWQRNDVSAALWEDRDTVWIREATPNTEFPIHAVPITVIWNDTGIPEQTPFNETVHAIRERRLSPLAIKRMPPKLQKQQTPQKVYKTLKERSAQLKQILARDIRILALTPSEIDVLTDIEIPKEPLDSHPTCLHERIASIENLFLECELSKEVVEQWIADWQGQALGNFAVALMNAMGTQTDSYSNPIGQVRAAVSAFYQYEDEIVQQMCSPNVQDSVNPEWTYWHQLRSFFKHYPRDDDAPMQWSETYLKFWMPPKLPSDVKRLLLISPSFSDPQLRKVFPDEDMAVVRVEPTAWVPGNKVFQLRAGGDLLHEILNYDGNSSIMELSQLGERYFRGIRAEVDRDPNITHAIVTTGSITDRLADLVSLPNVHFVSGFKMLGEIETDFEAVQVLWIVGTPHIEPHIIWREAQMLFGNDEKPLNYEGDIWTGDYKDERIQEIFNQKLSGLLTQVVGRVGLNRNSGKTLMLLTDFELPDITDRLETFLFDWEDFEIAGGLHKLQETIHIREGFEVEQANLTAETSREEVERILGCSSRQANRVLNKLRGGNIPRITIQEQILSLLASGHEKTTASLVAAIDSSPQAIGNKLKQLLDAGEIVRVQRGVYTLPETKASEYVGWIKEKQNQ
ncbi:hypothetical protein F4212_13960 [Candidatus Poribacteria bacterium]|nr:hypothetical protein [Candidatus Poribacteria bacterium]